MNVNKISVVFVGIVFGIAFIATTTPLKEMFTTQSVEQEVPKEENPLNKILDTYINTEKEGDWSRRPSKKGQVVKLLHQLYSALQGQLLLLSSGPLSPP